MTKFVIQKKTPERLSSIMDLARKYSIFPYEVVELGDAPLKAKVGRKWKEENIKEGDCVFACGLNPIKVISDNYDAKLNKYRRYQNYVSDPENRVDFFSDFSSDSVKCAPDFSPNIWFLDIETNGLNAFAKDAKILNIAINGKTVAEFPDEDPALIVGHNLKFDLIWLKRFGVDLTKCELYDTMIAEHLIDENGKKGLDDLIFKYTTLDNYWHHIDFTKEIEVNTLSKYNEMDTIATYMVWEKQSKLLTDMTLMSFEMMKLKSLLEIELNGMKTDCSLLNEKLLLANSEKNSLETELKKTYPKMNFNSGPQLRYYLYTEKGYEIEEYTEKGNPSVDNKVLQTLSEKYPEDILLRDLSKLRTTSKIISTYYENINALVDNEAFLHGNFNQAQVVTGRLSSGGGINFQNIPARNKDAVETLFVSRYGKDGEIIKIDYSQLELRVLAELSRDRNMVAAFFSGVDLHTRTSELLGIDRQKAKTMNFRIVYGGGTREETEAWFNAYPGAKQWIDEQVAFYYQNGYTKSLTGRIRHLPPPSDDWSEMKHIERQAVNSIVQGLASDITQMAIHKLLKMGFCVINTVHDSILIDILKGKEDVSLLKLVCETFPIEYMDLTFNYKWECPLEVVIERGDSWGGCK